LTSVSCFEFTITAVIFAKQTVYLGVAFNFRLKAGNTPNTKDHEEHNVVSFVFRRGLSVPVLGLSAAAIYLRRIIFLLIGLCALTASVSAQDDSNKLPLKDTVPVKDSPVTIPPESIRITAPDTVRPVKRERPVVKQNDTLTVATTGDSVLNAIPEVYDSTAISEKPTSLWTISTALPFSVQLLQHHPFFGFGSKPVIVHSDIRIFKGKEVLFYALIGLLLMFALLRESFPKYFNDIFRLLFRNTLKQKQIREQLMQTTLPSLLLNAFYALTAGFYIDLLLQHYGVSPIDNFWLLLLYCSAGLLAIYFIKFIGLKVTGWLFNIRAAADSYIFVVFIINKVIGIFLLPFVVLLAFMQGNAYNVAMVLSWCGIGVLFIYRFLLTYTSIRNQVRFNPFHFFLYLCAFEIAPLLLIYKALLFFFP